MYFSVTKEKYIMLMFHGSDYVIIWLYSETFLNKLGKIMTTIISISDVSLVYFDVHFVKIIYDVSLL
jgi:hypothetical protein